MQMLLGCTDALTGNDVNAQISEALVVAPSASASWDDEQGTMNTFSEYFNFQIEALFSRTVTSPQKMQMEVNVLARCTHVMSDRVMAQISKHDPKTSQRKLRLLAAVILLSRRHRLFSMFRCIHEAICDELVAKRCLMAV